MIRECVSLNSCGSLKSEGLIPLGFPPNIRFIRSGSGTYFTKLANPEFYRLCILLSFRYFIFVRPSPPPPHHNPPHGFRRTRHYSNPQGFHRTRLHHGERCTIFGIILPHLTDMRFILQFLPNFLCNCTSGFCCCQGMVTFKVVSIDHTALEWSLFRWNYLRSIKFW